MEDVYFPLRATHMTAVAVSGSLFLLRALALNVFDARWPRAAPVRYLSYTVDTILLASALTLTTIIGQYPFADHWLTAKVLLLVVYIALGIQALRPTRERRVRVGFTLAAAAVFLFIVTIARAHHPLGLFAGLW